jgi:hypothetical protein
MVTIEIMNEELKDAIRQFTLREKGIDWARCLSVTLTMKQSAGGEKLDDITASRNMSHFLKRLNIKVLGNAYRRYGHQVNVIPIQECTERIHFHLLIEVPTDREKSIFKSQMMECWSNTNFAHAELCIKEFSDDYSLQGWGDYITKFNDGDTDQLDWENYHWNC